MAHLIAPTGTLVRALWARKYLALWVHITDPLLQCAGAGSESKERIRELYEKIGELTMERDFFLCARKFRAYYRARSACEWNLTLMRTLAELLP